MYSIKALRNSEIAFPVPGSVMYYQDKLDQHVRVVTYFWLLRGEGKTICVDTGLGLPPQLSGQVRAAEPQVFGNFTVGAGMDTLSLLHREGVAPEDMDYVILTHLHYDHCANVRLFPRAQILISEYGWHQTMSPPHPSMVPAHLFPQDVFAYLLHDAWDRVQLLPNEATILPGLEVFWVGGHTPCSQAVKVATTKGAAIITGDVVFYYGNLEENIPVACLTNLAECYLAMDRIRAEADLVLPSHDPLVMHRHPDGCVA